MSKLERHLTLSSLQCGYSRLERMKAYFLRRCSTGLLDFGCSPAVAMAESTSDLQPPAQMFRAEQVCKCMLTRFRVQDCSHSLQLACCMSCRIANALCALIVALHRLFEFCGLMVQTLKQMKVNQHFVLVSNHHVGCDRAA